MAMPSAHFLNPLLQLIPQSEVLLKMCILLIPSRIPPHITCRASENNVDASSIGGNYDWTFNPLIRTIGDSGVLSISVLDTSKGEVEISGFDMDVKIKGIIDYNASTLTIPSDQNLGIDAQGYQNYFYLKEKNDKGDLLAGLSDKTASIGVIDGDKITFSPEDIWAIGDYNDEASGFIYLTDENVFTKKKEVDPSDPNSGWTSLGNATLQDGWVLPRFGIDQRDAKNWYEVELQQNDENPNLYRLVDPYKGNCPVKDKNTSKTTGYIQFNVSNPDFVTFDEVDAGFVCGSVGISKMFASNMVTYYCKSFKISLDDFIKNYSYSPTFKTGSTFKNGVVTLPAESTFLYGWYNDTTFGYPGDPDGGAQWTDPDNNRKFLNMETKIFFPSLSGIFDNAVDDLNAEVEYYNLQGVRVEKPRAGEIVVKRQGTSVSKIIF